MRPEIIPHSYMGNTLYDLCCLWRLTVSLANAPAALECRALGQDLLKFFFFSIRNECVIIFASFSLGPMMFYCMQITTSTVVNGYNWLWENHKLWQSQNSKFGNLESVYLFIYFSQGMNREWSFQFYTEKTFVLLTGPFILFKLVLQWKAKCNLQTCLFQLFYDSFSHIKKKIV